MNKQPSKWWLVLCCAALLLLTFIAFSPVLKNGFINWDDNATVFENPVLPKGPLEALRYYFSGHFVIGNYIPLTMLVYALEYSRAGLDPHFYHGLQLALHLANVLLVFGLILGLSRGRVFVAALVAALFALHPMHVESVAWIAELKDVLYSLFFLLALIVYHRGLLKPAASRRASLWLTFVFFILSLLSKPAAVVLPLCLLLLDFYEGRIRQGRVWLEKIPFLLLSLLFGLLALKAQAADRLLLDRFELPQRMLYAAHSLLRYLWHAVWPGRQAIFHPYPQGDPAPLVYASPVLVLLLAYLVFRLSKGRRWLSFGFLFFVCNLLLVLQLVSVGEAVMAERYTYMAYLGIFFAAAMALDDWVQRRGKGSEAVVLVSVMLCLTLSVLSYQRCKVWRDDFSIAEDLFRKYPGDPLVLNNKGFIMHEQKLFDQALLLYNQALAVKPDYERAAVNRVNCLLDMQRVDEASAALEESRTHLGRSAHLLNQEGYIEMWRGHHANAARSFEKALVFDRKNVFSYLQLSQCYFVLHDTSACMRTIERGLAEDPGNYILLNNKGYTYMLRGQLKEALQYFDLSLAQKPDYDVALANRRNCSHKLDSLAALP